MLVFRGPVFWRVSLVNCLKRHHQLRHKGYWDSNIVFSFLSHSTGHEQELLIPCWHRKLMSTCLSFITAICRTPRVLLAKCRTLPSLFHLLSCHLLNRPAHHCKTHINSSEQAKLYPSFCGDIYSWLSNHSQMSFETELTVTRDSQYKRLVSVDFILSTWLFPPQTSYLKIKAFNWSQARCAIIKKPACDPFVFPLRMTALLLQ